MQKKKTYFEQVPIETLRSILEEDAQHSKLEPPTKPESKIAEEALFLVAARTRSGGRK